MNLIEIIREPSVACPETGEAVFLCECERCQLDTITLRHLPGSCCPEKDCGVGSWDGKHCRSCGADCSTCEIRPNLDGGQP